MIEYKTNKVNTDLDEALLNSLTKEERETILEYTTSIVFLQNLISPNRKLAKDLERWDNPDNDTILSDSSLERIINPKGKIRLDFSNPHIIEDTKFFREAAIHFEEHGVYTFLKPDRNPYSDYRKFWDKQIERCWNGMLRESDGEWITGQHYFYLNFSPVMKSVKRKGSARIDRIQGLPDFYDGDYWFFHYIERARENGKHTCTLKKRGAGYSLKGAGQLGRNFILGESKEADKNTVSLAIANEKEYLTKDGVLNKFIDVIDFCSKHTPFPNRRELKDSWQTMHWQMGWKDNESGLEKGNKNQVMGVTLKNDPEKARGKRAIFILWEEFGKFKDSITAWNIARPSVEDGEYVFGLMSAFGCLTAGNKVWDNEGNLVNVEDIYNNGKGILGYETGKGISKENIIYWQAPAKKECIKITTNKGRSIECSLDHPILWSHQSYGSQPRVKGTTKRPFVKDAIFREAELIKVGEQICVIEEVDVWSEKEMWNPRLVGLLIGDGSYGKDKTPVISNCDKDINDYVYSNFDAIEESGYTTKDGREYKETRIRNITKNLREIGIYGQTKNEKTLPLNIHSYSKNTACELIAGFFDADGYYNDKGRIVLSSSSRNLMIETQLLLQKLGIHSNIMEIKANISENRIDKNNYFRLEIADKRSIIKYALLITPMIGYKKEALERMVKAVSLRDDYYSKEEHLKGLRFERVVSIEKTGLKEIFNLTADKTHTYIGNGIVTHNTGGTEGASFKGLRELFYNPKGYNVYQLDNVYDKNVKAGIKCAFFHAGYLNQMGYMDEDGNSDVIMSLLSVIRKRIEIKYNSSEAHTLTQTIAEMALTPQEAIMKSTGSMFPTVDIRDYLEESRVNYNRFTEDQLVGDLVIKNSGNIEFEPNFDKSAIRTYNMSKVNTEGAVVIYSKPQIDSSIKKPYAYRYIAGIDPIDNDYTETGSLGCIVIYDLWNEEIVADYIGRPQLADDFYEICRRMLLYYNAVANYENNIKGLFGYFNNKTALNLLCDTPSYLRDVEEQKQNLFGNRAHPYSEKVYTPEGIKKWEDIKIGDLLFNSYGGTTKVIDIPFDEVCEVYEITLKDGRKIKASGNHLWDVINWSGYKKTLSTIEILKDYYRYKGKYKESKYYIEKNKGVDYEDKEVPIEHYLLGLLLGDGCFTNSKHNNADFASGLKDIEEYKKIIPNEIYTKDDRHHSIRFIGIGEILKKLNLHDKKSRTKFIPDEYKYNTREKRLNILKGLLDTDGTVSKDKVSYCSTSKQLAKDVIEIARSLGINCNLNVSKNKFGEIYIVIFYTDIILFNLPRKAVKQKITKTRHTKTGIVNIEKIGIEQSKCVTVDSIDNCYLIGDFVKTHNSKGTRASSGVIADGLRLQKTSMLSEAEVLLPNGDIVKTIRLRKIKSLRYLEELYEFNVDGNFDYVSAMNMVMILRQDRIKITESLSGEIKEDYIEEDSFIRDNYDSKVDKLKYLEIDNNKDIKNKNRYEI